MKEEFGERQKEAISHKEDSASKTNGFLKLNGIAFSDADWSRADICKFLEWILQRRTPL